MLKIVLGTLMAGSVHAQKAYVENDEDAKLAMNRANANSAPV